MTARQLVFLYKRQQLHPTYYSLSVYIIFFYSEAYDCSRVCSIFKEEFGNGTSPRTGSFLTGDLKVDKSTNPFYRFVRLLFVLLA